MRVPTAHDVTAHDATALKPKAKPGPCALPPPNLQGAGKAHPGLRPAPMPTRQTRRMHRSHWRWRMPPRERGQRRRRRRQRQTQRPRPQQRLGLQGKGGRQGRRVAKTSWQAGSAGMAGVAAGPSARRSARRRAAVASPSVPEATAVASAEAEALDWSSLRSREPARGRGGCGCGQPRWAWAGWAGCCCLQHFQSACQGCGNADKALTRAQDAAGQPAAPQHFQAPAKALAKAVAMQAGLTEGARRCRQEQHENCAYTHFGWGLLSSGIQREGEERGGKVEKGGRRWFLCGRGP